MTEEEIETPVAEEEAVAEEAVQKIMCFVSKQMVPITDTVEIEYAPRKKVRVLPKYVRYEEAAAEA